MKVLGHPITQSQISDAVSRMQQLETFQAYQVEAEFRKGILLHEIAMRAADRLISREKRKGNIKFLGNRNWKWIGSKT